MLRLGLSTASVLATSLLLGPFASAQAADPAPKDKVYLDPDSLQFNAPLRQGADQTIEVFTLLPPGSEATITYYPVYHRATACPDPAEQRPLTPEETRKAKIRTFVPGAKQDDDQRYTTFIGPLSVGVRYCFRLDVVEPRTLDEQEVLALGRALGDALEASATWPTAGNYPHATACGLPNDAKGRAPTSCEIAAAIEAGLGWTETELQLALPGESEARPFRDGFEELWRRDETFRRAFVGLFIDTKAEAELLARYEAEHRKLREWKDLPVRYDPLPAVDLDALRRAARSNAELRKRVGALSEAIAGKDPQDIAARKALVTELATLPKELRDVLLRKLPETARLQLKTYYEASSPQNLPFVVDQTTHDARVSRLEPALGVTVLGPAAAKELEGLPQLDVIVNAKDYAGSGAARALRYVGILNALAEHSKDANATATTLASGLKQSLDAMLGKGGKANASHYVYEAFLGKLTALRRLDPRGQFTYEPGFEDRFPLYATGELGLAALVIASNTSDDRRGLEDARGDFITYFGVNFYFTALDKEEPLMLTPDWLEGKEARAYRRRSFWRRFAVQAGVSVANDPRNGIKGVIGQQYVLLGAGFRVTDHLRLGGGAAFFRYASPNPLSSQEPFAATPYISAGLDADVIGTIQRWRGRLDASKG